MLEWILKNKEWLFSGVGIVVFGGIWALIRKFFRPGSIAGNTKEKILQTEEKKSIVKVPAITQITPTEIYNSIENISPLQQQKIADNYTGLHVEWETEIKNLSQDRDNDEAVNLWLSYPNNSYKSKTILCVVSLKEYKQLANAKKGTRIIVNGKIGRFVVGSWIYLENVKLKFLKLVV